MAISTTELEALAGQWVAEDREGNVIAHATELDDLEQILIKKLGFSEDRLPAIRHVPEDGSTTFIL
jgi:hypothetical protein